MRNLEMIYKINRNSLLYRAFAKNFRKLLNRSRRKKLRNNNFTIISSNCLGGFIYHDLNHEFMSPTINLFLESNEFIKFVANMEKYLSAELIEIKDTSTPYPLAKLSDITIHFVHYSTFDDAKIKWDIRKERINFDNMFIIMTDRDGANYNTLCSFEKLPYTNKIVFTHKKYPEFQSAHYIPGFENETSVGELNQYTNLLGKRYYDEFDYVQWLNSSLKD